MVHFAEETRTHGFEVSSALTKRTSVSPEVLFVRADDSIDFLVRPSFRPDRAVNIHKEGFAQYIKKLAEVTG